MVTQLRSTFFTEIVCGCFVYVRVSYYVSRSIFLSQVYTDYPGSIGAGVTLVNDLNLVVIQGRDQTGYLGTLY